MFSFQIPRLLSLGKKKSIQIPVPVISDNLVLASDYHGKKLSVLGEFPRRVSIGDVLMENEQIKILSPINGIAKYNESLSSIFLRVDGELFFKPSLRKSELAYKELKEKVHSLGLSSLDFPGKPILSLLESFRPNKDSYILFAPFTHEDVLDYKEKILSQYRDEFDILKKNLEKIYPDSKILNMFSSADRAKFSYPEGSPRYFLYKYCGESVIKDFPHDKYLYLGPETIFHLIRGLYYGIPFHERYIEINMIRKGGSIEEGETKVFLLKNGVNLLDFLLSFKEKYNYRYFTINSYYDKQPVYEIGTEFIFDIHKHHSVIICDDIYFEKVEGICIDCNNCSYYCPVNADPRELLEKDKSKFKESICLDCGICSLYCPAHIDFVSRITERKKGIQIAVS